MLDLLKNHLQTIKQQPDISDFTYRQGHAIYLHGQVQLLTQSQSEFSFVIDDEFDDFVVHIQIDEGDGEYDRPGTVESRSGNRKNIAQHHRIAAMLQLAEELDRLNEVKTEGMAYTREGMIRRVMQERADKAVKAEYRIEFSDNPFGEHRLYNERGVLYKIMFRNRQKELGYCTCPDYRTNKLGTCKHLLFAFNQAKESAPDLLTQPAHYPFVEIFPDPLHDYSIAWFGPQPEQLELAELLNEYFDSDHRLKPEKTLDMVRFLYQARDYKQVRIRPEAQEIVEKAYNQRMLEQVKQQHSLDYSVIKAKLFPHQREGVEFATFREAVIIADDMGLGKTLQAITTAIMKKKLFGFTRTLIICPASLKDQWKLEIEKFSDEKAEVVAGKPEERERQYRDSEAFFLIINYETVLRDREAINSSEPDFIVLDEAQRIKNYETRTANSVKALEKKHALVITGTPIENKLLDLFSIMDFLDPYFLTPLWEFSYQHCYFDKKKKNRITGYYNLQHLKERMQQFLLRREKREVIKDLPNISQIDIPLDLHPNQQDYHAGFAKSLAKIIRKKFLTAFDINRIMLLLNQMRMVCDSTFLIDKETNYSPKLIELQHILTEKLDIQNTGRKVIIFSEWTRMTGLIGKMLRENDIGFTELSGKVPVKKRQALVEEFFENPSCQVFLSTEAGGAGLNLQVADTVINFELPWNPAKKNQRIGRIDRLGQRNEHLTVINLITRNSIETRIATGLALKQNLFDGVLNADSDTDIVDFSTKGRAQFLKQLENMLEEIGQPGPAAPVEVETSFVEELIDPVAESEPGKGSATPAESHPETTSAQSVAAQAQQMEQVMNQGLEFLSGLFKMATGQDMGMSGKSVEIDQETGEVVMRFKMPGTKVNETR